MNPDLICSRFTEEDYKRNGIFDINDSFSYDGVTYEILCTNNNFSGEDYNENLMSYFKIIKKKRKCYYQKVNYF